MKVKDRKVGVKKKIKNKKKGERQRAERNKKNTEMKWRVRKDMPLSNKSEAGLVDFDVTL